MQACCSLEESAADHHKVARARAHAEDRRPALKPTTRTHAAGTFAARRAVAPLHAEEVS
jgi:hypothetical protein